MSSLMSCPAWCCSHVPADGSTLHISDASAVIGTYDGEHSQISVSIERLDPLGRLGGPAGIRLAGEGPMTALEALHLSATLQAAAVGVLLDAKTPSQTCPTSPRSSR